MSTRPELVAQRREIQGKAVRHLRAQGLLPAVVYGHGQASESLQIEDKAFALLRRQAGRNALVDLKVDGGTARPVMVHAVQEHPVSRKPLHVDFYLVKMTEEMTVDVPIAAVGTSFAVDKLGGTLLHFVDTVRVRALPTDLPSSLEFDITPLETFETTLHARDLRIPERVTLVTDLDEPIARVQAPRVEEAPVVAEAAEGAPEGEAQPAEGAAESEGDSSAD
ncbi:MAG TPA: 50S ribosomal protein L25 [Candidatus Limnocylindrales bacterium]|jgi:large subunit ribosomal protein L25|nr:50S ribosomal protein L25 [Candidatus Limnocylindrales bacterium]